MEPVWKRIVGKGLFTIFFLVPLMLLVQIPIFLAGAGLATYLVFSKDLGEIPSLQSYEPKTVSTFYSDDGTVIGVFYNEKRFVVDAEQIPQHVVSAFLAAEDARFFEHSGVDWLGLLRAFSRNIMAGRIVQGGSTITMQVTRNFLLTKERTFSRKIKEIILALRLEKVWGKKKILHVYLNEIFLGERCYGVEAAARGYFNKPVEHLTVGEAALIAGLIASPTRFNPFKNEDLARQRQATVLSRMLKAGFITQEQYREASNERLHFNREQVRPFDLVPDFSEAVRRYIISKYGQEKLLNEGLKVFTTCRVDFQRKAVEDLQKGVEEIKARQKHLAILRTVHKDEIPELLQRRRTPELAEGRIYQGIVVRIVPRANKELDIHVALSKRLQGRVRLAADRGGLYKVGQVLALRFDKFVDDVPHFTLDDNPKLQGALVCIENRTGYVRSLVGGVSGELFQFNRAIQAKRQPGSAFKPIIYSVAIEEKSYSPATIIVDEPLSFGITEKEEDDWTPKNAGGDFLGPLSLRRALELSRNICTAKILYDVELDPVLATAKRMGITSPLGRNLSLSLGTSELSLLELTSVYTVFPNSGVHVTPTLVKRIEDRFGNVLEDNTDLPLLDESEIPTPIPRKEFRELWPSGPWHSIAEIENEHKTSVNGSTRVRAAISPETAYIMTQLLQGGVVEGTGASLGKYLKRKDLAGKTGTTNNSEDAWFIGFNPDYTTGVWVGFDEKRPLGHREEGSRAALPIWGYFMRDILVNRPEKEFPVPPDIVFQEMLTFSGSSKAGTAPKMVREPIYKPFAGRTLILSPLDAPEALSEYYQPTPLPPPAAPWQIYNAPPNEVYPVQPGPALPLQQSIDPRYAPPGQTPQNFPPSPSQPGPYSSWNPQQQPTDTRLQQGGQIYPQPPVPGSPSGGGTRLPPEAYR
ncbi:MAG TPA: PBP1A family penicillin-binding protein [Desulfomonilaceae bacterium]|nr:PBP1A family penicillin-binding protein [Desulfomonilaceae bacterium]